MRALPAILVLAACVRPAEERALADLEVGRASAGGVTIEVEGGLAAIRALDDGEATLWAQAPTLALTITTDAPRTLIVTIENALPDAALTGAATIDPLPAGPPATQRRWRVALPAGATALALAPPDAGDLAPWRFAALADIQDALPRVHELFAAIEATPGVRFAVAMGDITQRSTHDEWVLWDAQLATLDLPLYATIGNHDIWFPHRRWTTRFGRANVHFTFRGVAFTLVDSASATIDALVYAWLDEWLAGAADRVHVFGTHYPPIDPVGLRYGSFASTREGQKLLAMLAGGAVDLTLYGHIHTFTAFENAGIAAYVSGGGGAEPMRLDGVDRHFLVVDVDPAAQRIDDVTVVEVPDTGE